MTAIIMQELRWYWAAAWRLSVTIVSLLIVGKVIDVTMSWLRGEPQSLAGLASGITISAAVYIACTGADRAQNKG